MNMTFNAYLESGQAILSAIPKRAASVLSEKTSVIPIPNTPIVTVATIGQSIVAWTCSFGITKDTSVRIGYLHGEIRLAYDSTQSLELLREVSRAGVLQSYHWSTDIARWVSNNY